MKKQKNQQKLVLGLMAAGFIVLLAGCPPVESPGTTGDSPVIAAGQGLVRVSLGGAARTLMPGEPVFTKYELTFTSSSSGIEVITEVVNPPAPGGGVIEVALATGDWRLALTAYTTPSGYTGYYPAAYGVTPSPFDLGDGELVPVDIDIAPINDANPLWVESNKGIFKYAINYPASAVSGTMTLTGGDITLPSVLSLSLGGTAIGSMELAPGTYNLSVILRQAVGIAVGQSADENHQPLAGTYTAVHIYPGLVTEAIGQDFTFTDADFVDAVYLAGTVKLIVPGNSTTLQVKEVKVTAYSDANCETPILDGELTIPYPVVTPGTTSIPWFLSIPLSATQGAFYLEVTLTDGNDHPFIRVFPQSANSVQRQGNENLTLDSLTINLAGVTVDFSGAPADESTTLTGSSSILYWKDNTSLTITVPTGFTVESWHLDGALLDTANPLSKTARDFSPGNHIITARVSLGGKTYSKTVSFTVKDGIYFTSAAEFEAWLATKADNDKDTPYTAKLLIDLETEYESIINAIGGKYVALDFSDSTGTTISGTYAGPSGNPNKAMIVSVILPDTLTSIGASAFQSCAFTTIDLPDSVTSIGRGAFEGCASLTTIDLPASLTTIVDYAFYRCTSLTTVDLPASLTTIAYRAFQHCASLVTVTLRRTDSPLTTLGTQALSSCHANMKIYVPADRVADYQGASGWSAYASKIQAIQP